MTKTLKIKSARRPLRNLLLSVVGTAALAVGSTAKAGVPDDIIAYYLGVQSGVAPALAIAAGQVELKGKGPAFQTVAFQNRLLAATISALKTTSGSVPTELVAKYQGKTTAGAILAYTLKRLPQFAPTLASAASSSSLNTANVFFKYSVTDGGKSRITDSNKIINDSLTAALKAYPKGTQNVPTTGAGMFVGVTIADYPFAITAVTTGALQGAIDAATTLSQSGTTISTLATTAIKKAASSVSKNPLSPGAAVTGLVAQYAGLGRSDLYDPLNVESVAYAAIKGAAAGAGAKNLSVVTQAAAYALYAVYLNTTISPTPLSPLAYIAAISPSLRLAIQDGLKKNLTEAQLADFRNSVTLGVGAANSSLETLGAGAVSNGGFFNYNNGVGTPVTDIAGS